MNYYKRHLGDYARKAGHLSMLEHGAYTLILDAYYDREQAPTKAEAIRWARARNPEETQTVSTILQEFFFERDGRYYQQRVEDELQEARSKAERNRIVGKFGGRPPRARKTQTVSFGLPDGFEKRANDHSTESYPQPRTDHCDASCEQNACRVDPINGAAMRATGSKTQMVSSGLPNGFQTEPQSTNPLIQDLKEKDAPAGELFPDVQETVIRDFKKLRNKLRAPITETAAAGIRREAGKAGITVESALRMCCERGWRGFKAEWVTQSQTSTPTAGTPRKRRELGT